MFRVSDGVTASVEITDEEAREIFDRAAPYQRSGSLELGFEVLPDWQSGEVLTWSGTRYGPIKGER